MISKTLGYRTFTANQTLNFLLNRLAWELDSDGLSALGERVSTIDDFTAEMLRAAEEAESEDRLRDAAFFYRGAEFFLPAGDERKAGAFDRFMEYFYESTPGVKDQRQAVPYGGGKLGAIDVPAAGSPKGTLLCCSGYDGLIEELYGVALALGQAGYRVVLYEGPGQGSALRWSKLPMTHDWERPTAAVLDHFGIEGCTVVGVSLGGYLAPRAAAFEKRIERLVCWGAMYDFPGCFKSSMDQAQAEALFGLVGEGHRDTVNGLIEQVLQVNPASRWAFSHGKHVSGREDWFGFLEWTLDFHLKDVAERITQDTLIMMGSRDHLVPPAQMRQQAEALVNAKSVTTRWMTEAEEAAQHCQIGNPQLVVDEILLWMEGLDRRDRLFEAAS